MKHGKLESKLHCLKCKENVDGFSCEEDASPRDGDISICVYCGTIGKYAQNVTKLEPMTESELESIKLEEPEVYKQLQDASLVISYMSKNKSS